MKAFCYTVIGITILVSIIIGVLSFIEGHPYGFIYIAILTFFNLIIPTLLAVSLYQFLVLNTRLRSHTLYRKIFILLGFEAAGLLIWIVLDVMLYYSSPANPLGAFNAFSTLENFTGHIDHEFIFGAFLAFIYAILIPISITYFSKEEVN